MLDINEDNEEDWQNDDESDLVLSPISSSSSSRPQNKSTTKTVSSTKFTVKSLLLQRQEGRQVSFTIQIGLLLDF